MATMMKMMMVTRDRAPPTHLPGMVRERGREREYGHAQFDESHHKG